MQDGEQNFIFAERREVYTLDVSRVVLLARNGPVRASKRCREHVKLPSPRSNRAEPILRVKPSHERFLRNLCEMSIALDVCECRLRRALCSDNCNDEQQLERLVATVRPLERLLERTSMFKTAIKRLCN